MGELQQLKETIDILIYILSALGVFEFGKSIIGFLFRDFFNRGKDDIKQLSGRVGDIERKHNECPIDEQIVKIGNLEKEQERIRNKLDSLFKHQ